MVGEIEGIGEAVTGGMLARAVEPKAGEGRGEEGRGEEGLACLNCRTLLIGGYCHTCGQSAHVHRSLKAFAHDLAHSVLHFEGKSWRTLPMLALHPGDVTRRYIEGERARFVSPMALFLFSVFLMFAVFSTIGGPIASKIAVDPAVHVQLRAERDAAVKRLAELERQRDVLRSQGARTSNIDSRIAEARAEAGAISALYGDTEAIEPGIKIDGIPDDNWFNNAYRKARENPSLLAYKLQANAYKFSWALIPISVPFVWLLFLFRREYKAFDHIVFVTYSIACMTVLVVALSAAHAIGVGEGLIVLALILIPPLHMYRQLRGAYQLPRFGAAWRTMLLAMFAPIAALLFFLMLVAIGIM
jgi:hypothetical protein